MPQTIAQSGTEHSTATMEGLSACLSEPPNDPPAVAKPQPKRRNKLGPDGVAILEAYWLSNSNPLQLPPLNDKKELTRKIKELPGCDFWSDRHTSDWFKRRMKKFQKDPAFREIANFLRSEVQANLLGLSLALLVSKLVSPSKDALQHLGVLLKGQPNPSSDVIKTWATLFAHDGGSSAVELWIGYITQVVQALPDSALPPSANLPTPAGTVTPEPLIPQASGSGHQPLSPTGMKLDPADSPILSSLAIQTQSTAASSPSSSTAGIESPISPFLRDGQMQPPVPSLRAIIGEASQHPIDRIRPLPNDADEFLAMFAPYEAKLTKLLHILESG